MAIKLVAIDVDDTLLDNNRTVSPRVADAIRRAVAQGVTVTLATGRMFRSALPYARQLGLDVPLVTYNGALIRSSLSGQTLLHRPLAMDTAIELLAFCRERGRHVQVYMDDVLYVKERDAATLYYENIAGITAVPVGEEVWSPREAPTKLLIIAAPEQLPAVQAEIRAVFGDRVYTAASRVNYLEVTDPGVNKGLAVAFLAERLGVSRSEVMAVGDSANDVDMISYAGCGVAMGNAHPAVKAAAGAVTAANDADGVAEAIERYVLFPA